jgi:N-acetylmuramoyl-L-alanine amidase
MAIGNKQIGWSQEANLLWEIAKQLDAMLKACGSV